MKFNKVIVSIGVMLFMGCIASLQAQTVTVLPVDPPSISPVVVAATPTIIQSGFCPINISGDTLWGDGHVWIAAGYDIATFKNGMYDIRASWGTSVTGGNQQIASIGFGINIVKFLQNHGASWIPANVSSGLGANLDVHQTNNGNVKIGGVLRLTIIGLSF
jgi:hypothetical protein